MFWSRFENAVTAILCKTGPEVSTIDILRFLEMPIRREVPVRNKWTYLKNALLRPETEIAEIQETVATILADIERGEYAEAQP